MSDDVWLPGWALDKEDREWVVSVFTTMLYTGCSDDSQFLRTYEFKVASDGRIHGQDGIDMRRISGK